MKVIYWCLIAIFSSYTLSAQEAKSEAKVVKGKDTVVYEKNTEMNFDGRSLDGDIVNPNGAAVEADKNLYFESLFEEREDFKSELKRSTGAL